MRKRFVCEEQDVPAPRVECRCRACYRVREISLDPRLIDLIREGEFSVLPTGQPGEFSVGTFGPARQVVRHAVEMYLIGKCEWASLYFEITKMLVEQNDDLFKQAMTLANLQPARPFIIGTAPL